MRVDGTDVKRKQRGRRRIGGPTVPAAAVLAAGLLLAGCTQLALQEPFMHPLNATATAIGERVSGVVAEARARQAAGRACNRTPRDVCPPEPAVAPRSDPRALDAVEAWEAGEAKQPAGEVAPASL